MKIAELALERIALDDTTFDLGYARRYDALRRSIAEVGVLQPLLVRQCDADRQRQRVQVSRSRFQIVCGFGRARVASELGLAPLPAQLLAPETSDGDCLRLALFDNLPHRRFNPIERATALSKLRRHVGRQQLVRDYMPLLGLQPNGSLLDRTLALAQLSEGLKRAVAEGRIEAKVGASLAALPSDDQAAFARLLERCQPSVSVVRELAEALADVARRDGLTIREILASPEVSAILDSQEMTRRTASERTAALRRHVRRLRYPTVSLHEARFADLRSALNLPPSMRLEPAPNFESDEIRLEIRFQNEEELRRSAAVLAGWFDDPSLLKRLWPSDIGPAEQ